MLVFSFEVFGRFIFLFIISGFITNWIEMKFKRKKKLDSNLDDTENNFKNKPKKRKTSKGAIFVLTSILVYIAFVFVAALIISTITTDPTIGDGGLILLFPSFIAIAFVIGFIIDLVDK